MKISIIHPSRGRAQKARATHDLWIKNLSFKHEVQYILSLDNDEPQADRYVDWAQECEGVRVLWNANRNLVMAVNNGAAVSTGDILIVVSDDFECPEHWDDLIVEAFKGHTGKILKVFCGIQKWIVTLPIMDREYYTKHGYMYHPAFTHMFADTHMTHYADLHNAIIWRNDIVFAHKHYSTGACEKDEVSTKADSTWAQGEAAYIKEIITWRDSWGIDVTAVSPDGQAIISWMRSKGIK